MLQRILPFSPRGSRCLSVRATRTRLNPSRVAGELTTSCATPTLSGWLGEWSFQTSLRGGRLDGPRGLFLWCELGQQRIVPLRVPYDIPKPLAAGRVPWRVVFLGDRQAGVAQQVGHVLHQDAGGQQGHREGVAEPVRVEIRDAGLGGHLLEARPPVPCGRHGRAAPCPEVVLPARTARGIEGREHCGRKAQRDQLSGLGALQHQVAVRLDGVVAERDRIPDA